MIFAGTDGFEITPAALAAVVLAGQFPQLSKGKQQACWDDLCKQNQKQLEQIVLLQQQQQELRNRILQQSDSVLSPPSLFAVSPLSPLSSSSSSTVHLPWSAPEDQSSASETSDEGSCDDAPFNSGTSLLLSLNEDNASGTRKRRKLSNHDEGEADGGARRGAWEKWEDDLLRAHVKPGVSTWNRAWSEIASHVPGRSAKQCRDRWIHNLDPNINRSPWTVEEDKTLLRWQRDMGNCWAFIAEKLPGRTENAVKTRFKSILRAKRRAWTPEDDALLMKLQVQLSKRWDLITNFFAHRTRNAVRTRYRLLQKAGGEHIPEEIEPGNPLQAFLPVTRVDENQASKSHHLDQESNDKQIKNKRKRQGENLL